MAATQFTITLGLQYTPPGTPTNSGVATLGTQGTANAQSVGVIDVPTLVVPPLDYDIPFGSIASATMALVKNLTANPIGLKFNGSITVNYTLAPGAIWMMAGPIAPTGTPLTAIAATVTVAPLTVTESLLYWIFGD